MLTSSRNTDTSRIIFNQISPPLVAQSGWHVKLTITESFIPCSFRKAESCKKSFLHGTETTVPSSMHPFAFRAQGPEQPDVKKAGPGFSLPQTCHISGQGMGVSWPHADYMLCILCTTCCLLCKQDGGLLSVWPLPTCLALGHGVPPFLPMSLTRLWPGGLPLHTSSQSPRFHVFVLLLGPDTPPTCMFFLFLFTWLILAHIFKPNSRILCIWYLCARIKKYFIHSTNSYRDLSTCQALFWDLVEDTTDKRTYLHITLILKRKTNKQI